MAEVTQAETEDGLDITLDLPIRAPELTLRIDGARPIRSVSADGVPLERATTHRQLRSGTYLLADDTLLVACDPARRHGTLNIVRG